MDSHMPITTCVFDAYGTLFDVAAAARLAAQEGNDAALANQWQKLAEIWRDKQLQYTWLRAITHEHCDFWQVTQDGLDFALEALSLDKNDARRERLLQLYWELQAYDEVPDMLRRLKEMGMKTAILSNGSPAMLDAAVASAGLVGYLDAILSVERVGVFKPNSRVYDLVGQHFNCVSQEVLFVSANGWDAAGATGYGFETAWVNRNNIPLDRLPHRPKHRLNTLHSLPKLAQS